MGLRPPRRFSATITSCPPEKRQGLRPRIPIVGMAGLGARARSWVHRAPRQQSSELGAPSQEPEVLGAGARGPVDTHRGLSPWILGLRSWTLGFLAWILSTYEENALAVEGVKTFSVPGRLRLGPGIFGAWCVCMENLDSLDFQKRDRFWT